MIDITVHDYQLPDGNTLPCYQGGNSDPGNATYHAGSSIQLLPGFKVKNGAYFHAYIEPFDCSAISCSKSPIGEKNEINEYIKNYYKTTNIETYTNFEKNEYELYSDNIQNINSSRLLAYPNPLSNSTDIQTNFPNDINARICIYDLLGNPIREIHNGYIASGTQTFSISLNDLTSGIYICKIEGENVSEQIRLIKL